MRSLQDAIIRLLKSRPFYGHLLLQCRRHAQTGGQPLGITLQSGSAEQVAEWLKQPVHIGTEEFNLEYPVVMGNDDVEMTWGPIYGFPTTFLIDQDWKIRKKWLGAVPDKSEQLRQLIDQLLEERAAEAGTSTD